MSTTTVDVALGARSYPIWIGAGLLADAARWRTAIRGRHVLVVTNETIAPLYLERVQAGLAGFAQAALVLPDGELHKIWRIRRWCSRRWPHSARTAMRRSLRSAAA